MHRAPRATESLILAAAELLDRPAAAEAEPERSVGEKPDASARVKPVTVEAFTSRSAPAAGEAFRIAFRVSVDEGWHINSSDPGLEYLVPTAIFPGEGSSYELEDLHYPPGKERRFGFAHEPLPVYEGTVWIEARAKAGDGKSGKGQPLRLKVRFQACNDRLCLPPETLVLEIPLLNASEDESGKARHRQVFEALSSAG